MSSFSINTEHNPFIKFKGCVLSVWPVLNFTITLCLHSPISTEHCWYKHNPCVLWAKVSPYFSCMHSWVTSSIKLFCEIQTRWMKWTHTAKVVSVYIFISTLTLQIESFWFYTGRCTNNVTFTCSGAIYTHIIWSYIKLQWNTAKLAMINAIQPIINIFRHKL